MKPNIELLKRLRTRFLRMKHKEHFNMESVAIKTQCGTAMCIAGHALDLAGYKFKFGEGRYQSALYTPSGRKVKGGWLQVAARAMGLDYDNVAYPLFHEFDIKTPKQAAERVSELIAEHSQ